MSDMTQQTVQKAIEELSVFTPGVFPREALQTLIDHQEAATPLLLDYLETCAADIEQATENEQNALILYALHLLAQFRETRAYAPLIKLLGQMDEKNGDFLGDLVTEGLSRIIASVCDGDIAPIQQLAENPNVYEFVRGSAFYSLATLVLKNRVEPETLKKYCRLLLSGQLQYEDGYLPVVLVNIGRFFGDSDLLPVVREAYRRWPYMVDFTKLESFEKEIVSGEVGQHELSYHDDFITDTISTLESWACFRPSAAVEDERGDDIWLPPVNDGQAFSGQTFGGAALPSQETYVREMPKVGRNDPCPCGSGKKFKKCCG